MLGFALGFLSSRSYKLKDIISFLKSINKCFVALHLYFNIFWRGYLFRRHV